MRGFFLDILRPGQTHHGGEPRAPMQSSGARREAPSRLVFVGGALIPDEVAITSTISVCYQ